MSEANLAFEHGRSTASMSTIKPIRTDADYTAALARIDALMDAEPGTPEGEELDILVDLVEHYELRAANRCLQETLAAADTLIREGVTHDINCAFSGCTCGAAAIQADLLSEYRRRRRAV